MINSTENLQNFQTFIVKMSLELQTLFFIISFFIFLTFIVINILMTNKKDELLGEESENTNDKYNFISKFSLDIGFGFSLIVMVQSIFLIVPYFKEIIIVVPLIIFLIGVILNIVIILKCNYLK